MRKLLLLFLLLGLSSRVIADCTMTGGSPPDTSCAQSLPTLPDGKSWTGPLHLDITFGSPTEYFQGKMCPVAKPGYSVGTCNATGQAAGSRDYGSTTSVSYSSTASVTISSGISASIGAPGWTITGSESTGYSITKVYSTSIVDSATLTTPAEDCKEFTQNVTSTEWKYGFYHTETKHYYRNYTTGTAVSSPTIITCNVV